MGNAKEFQIVFEVDINVHVDNGLITCEIAHNRFYEESVDKGSFITELFKLSRIKLVKEDFESVNLVIDILSNKARGIFRHNILRTDLMQD